MIMTLTIEWDSQARDFLRKLSKVIASRIVRKIDRDVCANVEHYLETLVGREEYKIRVGDYRLFVDYDKSKQLLIIRSIRHRKNAYK